ncbi:hypothetical protein J437_LFUL007152 [Ladona fulva]|uniref:Uncharacterized protein n=1 Tax=Ladona fulva TaxID=123851 RepID=A0A8K0K6K8_LADFU|nr:hypothetical protein J437_LFUL007152 [Ladona fulva]
MLYTRDAMSMSRSNALVLTKEQILMTLAPNTGSRCIRTAAQHSATTVDPFSTASYTKE